FNLLSAHNDGLGPLTGSNINLVNGWPLFVPNDPDDDVAPFDQANGTQGRNRTGDRSCFFQGLAASKAGYTNRIRPPRPVDNDCDDDANFGPDGCPGKCAVDDDGDGAIDNREEACPCYQKPDGIDDDGDGRVDEEDERARFYRCQSGADVGLTCGFPGAAR